MIPKDRGKQSLIMSACSKVQNNSQHWRQKQCGNPVTNHPIQLTPRIHAATALNRCTDASFSGYLPPVLFVLSSKPQTAYQRPAEYAWEPNRAFPRSVPSPKHFWNLTRTGVISSGRSGAGADWGRLAEKGRSVAGARCRGPPRAPGRILPQAPQGPSHRRPR